MLRYFKIAIFQYLINIISRFTAKLLRTAVTLRYRYFYPSSGVMIIMRERDGFYSDHLTSLRNCCYKRIKSKEKNFSINLLSEQNMQHISPMLPIASRLHLSILTPITINYQNHHNPSQIRHHQLHDKEGLLHLQNPIGCHTPHYINRHPLYIARGSMDDMVKPLQNNEITFIYPDCKHQVSEITSEMYGFLYHGKLCDFDERTGFFSMESCDFDERTCIKWRF